MKKIVKTGNKELDAQLARIEKKYPKVAKKRAKKYTKAQKEAALARLKRSLLAFQRAMTHATDVGLSYQRVMSVTMKIAMSLGKDKP